MPDPTSPDPTRPLPADPSAAEPAETPAASAPTPSALGPTAGEAAAADGTAPALVDAWPWARPIRLTGWLEREGFAPLLTALGVFVLAFILFQVVIAPIVIGVGIAIELAGSGQTETPDMAGILELAMENAALLMTANTLGQIGGFALLALAVARLHTPDVREYLRVRRADAAGLGMAALGWACLYPAVLWTGELNAQIPQPEWLEAMEQSQVDLLEGLLLGDGLSTGFLFVALALTPSVCEELLFRGYLQRNVERRWGAITSIVLVGVLFGLYHLRLSQAIPLSLLGVYLGFVVWATGSLWAGFLVHLLNNGLAVAATAAIRSQPDLDMEQLESMSVPEMLGLPWLPSWALGVAGLLLCGAVMRALAARRRAVAGDVPDARPIHTPLQTAPSA